MAGANARQTFTVFPTVLQVIDIAGADRLNAGMMAALEEIKRTTPNSLPPTWACTLYTTIASPIELLARAQFQELRAHIQTEAEGFAESYGLDYRRYPLKINECWFNYYSRGDSQEIHCHQNSVISGIYYVKASPGAAPTVFHSPFAEMMLAPPLAAINDFNSQAVGFEPQAGRMILFRSWLRHNVKRHEIDEPRVSIAFNITM